MLNNARDDLLTHLWQQHAPLPWLWPHDEPYERWFAQAIPALFACVALWQKHEAKANDILRLVATPRIQDTTPEWIRHEFAVWQKQDEGLHFEVWLARRWSEGKYT